ncbi:MAG: AAA family ATPase [Pirellulaceae bacterium]|nr:AAA family ATPase [Pirellulaceae bacterium]
MDRYAPAARRSGTEAATETIVAKRALTMYETFFGLNRRPFVPAPDPSYYFPAETIESARRNLLRCLQRGEGPGLVVGPSGTGKTLLCRVLAEQLRPTAAVVLLCSGRLSSRNALFQTILHGLGRPYRGMDEGESRLALIDYLTTGEDRPGALVLLVDEAQTLPTRLLDEIRLLTNLAEAGESRVRIVLAGSPSLEERFASPKLESFSQRLVARCYLEPFSRAETEQYVRAQIEAAGGDAVRLFSTEAATAVHRATDGVGRLVNQVCDHALVLAYADGNATVDARRIEEAWADLQQLPTPWTEEADSDAPDIIEFGGLDDDDVSARDELASAVPSRDEAVVDDSADLDLFAFDDEPDVRFEKIEQTLGELDPVAEAAEPIEWLPPPPADAPASEAASSDVGGVSSAGQLPAESFADEEVLVPQWPVKAASEPIEPRTRPAPTLTQTVDPPLLGPFVEEVVAADARTAARAGATIVAATVGRLSPGTTESNRASVRETTTGPTTGHDVIVLDDESGGEVETETVGPRLAVPRRDEYSRLFSKMRRK